MNMIGDSVVLFTEHHKSLQNLKEGEQHPKIVVENAGDADVTARDEGGAGAECLSIEQAKKQQVRRSSWCPEEERRKEDKSENLLYVSGRRCVELSSHFCWRNVVISSYCLTISPLCHDRNENQLEYIFFVETCYVNLKHDH